MKNSKKYVAVMIVCILLTLLVCSCAKTENEYLRLHIRANSNSEQDQTVKLLVRDAVIEHLTPLLTKANTVNDAKRIISNELTEIEILGTQILRNNGFTYGVKAELRRENFPAKSYGDLVLESGVYDAIIIELGSGTGDNWWCVAFPPLCFVGEGSGDIKYKSLLMEIIEKWRHNEKD